MMLSRGFRDITAHLETSKVLVMHTGFSVSLSNMELLKGVMMS